MKNRILRVLGILLGNLVLAFGIAAFSVPNHFLVGGVTGIARSMEYFVHVDMTVTVAVVNVGMFLVGYWLLGKEFALTTVISTVVFPLFLNRLLELEAIAHMTGDRLLAALAAGCLMGLGLGIVMRLGGSTGGMDIPPLALYKKLRIPVAMSMYCMDVVILLSQALFSNTEEILYGIVSVMLTSAVLNQVLIYGAGNVQVLIISREYEQINEMIQNQMDRGSTFLPIQTGYEKLEQKAIMCVLPSRDLTALNRYVQAIDPKAFIIINGVREVRGRGFTLDRHLA
ncbi:MAG: YitT family protein [Eubacteriales bacterium]|nr:YitT family protein [Eubacteriales bacterium]